LTSIRIAISFVWNLDLGLTTRNLMSVKARDSAQRVLAIIVIVAMLGVMGIPVSVILFFGVVTYFIWRAARRSEHHDSRRIFEFYIAANDILRDDERRWFGFEITEVINSGERVLRFMTDPPPLVYFALGVLYHRAGDHQAAVEHLSYIVENELSDERHRHLPSAELRRYVQTLRGLERDPTESPQTIGAIRSLERTRRNFGGALLDASRRRVNIIPTLRHAPGNGFYPSDKGAAETSSARASIGATQTAMTPPPPIADVLRDVYDEEKKTA
jgi:nitrogen fixation-related uncharacterized protein